MKLVHNDFLCPIEFDENEVNLLILENPVYMRKILESLYQQVKGEDGDWVLSDENKILKMDKYAEIIINPFDIDVNQKKLLAALYSVIDTEVQNSELLLEWNSLHLLFVNFAEKVSSQVFYDLSLADEFDVKDFLKFMNVKFYEEESSILEKMISYVRLVREMLGLRLIVFVNLHTYLSGEELKYLYEQAFYWKIHILVIENVVPEEKMDIENMIIIDKDACIISSNM